jgi:hypothetical protein
VFASEETYLLHDGAWVHVEMFRHPVVVTLEWAEVVNKFAADDVPEEDRRFLYIGHGEANMVRTSQTRDS